jgi:hypothetical protein
MFLGAQRTFFEALSDPRTPGNAAPIVATNDFAKPCQENRAMDRTQQRRPPKLRLLLIWTFVGIPVVWGFLETLRDALLLFR